MQKIKYLFILLCVVWPSITLAALLNNDMIAPAQEFADKAGFKTSDTPDFFLLVGKAIQYLLGFMGMIFLVLVISGGLQWMTAGGNTDKINKARARIINSAIGLGIVIAAYSITWFVGNVLFEIMFYRNAQIGS